MINIIIQITMCLTAWAVVLVRLRTMLNDFLAEAGDSTLEVQKWEIKGSYDLLGAAEEVGRRCRALSESQARE